jgi:hypothetical protein
MILKVFSPKNSAKKLAFSTQNKAKLCKILIITLVFEKNANFFAENRQKSQKILIITSTLDACHHFSFKILALCIIAPTSYLCKCMYVHSLFVRSNRVDIVIFSYLCEFLHHFEGR